METVDFFCYVDSELKKITKPIASQASPSFAHM